MSNIDPFDDQFDKFFNRVEQNSGKIVKAAVAVWILSAVISLIVLGFGIWAVWYLLTVVL